MEQAWWDHRCWSTGGTLPRCTKDHQTSAWWWWYLHLHSRKYSWKSNSPGISAYSRWFYHLNLINILILASPQDYSLSRCEPSPVLVAARSISPPLWMGCWSIAGLPSALNLPVSIILYSWVKRDTVWEKCLAQEHNTLSPARVQTQTA